MIGGVEQPSSLRRRAAFHTTDLEEARQHFGRLYTDVEMEPEPREGFGWTVHAIADAGAVRLVQGTQRARVKLSTPSTGDRYILALGGPGDGEHGGERLGYAPGRSGLLLSPGRSARLTIAGGAVGTNLVIERGALAAHLTALTGRAPTEAVVFTAGLDFERGPARALLEITRLFVREATRPGASPLLVAALRDALLTGVLTGVRHSASALLDPAPPRAAPASVRRAEEHIEAHATEPLALADIAAAAGVPARSLRAAFVAFRGVSPMEFLKQRRLDLARRWLSAAAPGTTVAGVVAALGLGNPGRFSAVYRSRFGEGPAETLARGRARAGLVPVGA